MELPFVILHYSNSGQTGEAKSIEELQLIYKKFKRLRGEVIEAALDVENLLKVTILHFIVGKDYQRHAVLRAFIFDAEFCSFMQKYKMLVKILKQVPDLHDVISPDDERRLKKELERIIEERNMFAHGGISLDSHDGSAKITYYTSSEKTEKIDEKAEQAIMRRYTFVSETLSELNTFLRENNVLQQSIDQSR